MLAAVQPQPLTLCSTPLLSISKAAKLEWLQKIGIKHDQLKRFIRENKIRYIDLTGENKKYRSYRLCENWLKEDINRLLTPYPNHKNEEQSSENKENKKIA